jgi:hypothetical protein
MQIKLRSSLRLLGMASLVLAATAFTANAARAASVDVPFAFTVGNKICPAGHYTLHTDHLGNSVELVGASQGFQWVIHPGDAAPTDTRVILKFDATGTQYALRSIQYGPMTTSRLDKKTKESISASNGVSLTAGMGQ